MQKPKYKSYTFWMTVAGALLVLLEAVGIRVNVEEADKAITALGALLVTLGILIKEE